MANKIKSTRTKQQNRAIIALCIGILLITVFYPLYCGFKLLMCLNCKEIGCGLCDLGAMILAIVEAIFGIVLTIVSVIRLRKTQKSKNNKTPIVQTTNASYKNRKPKSITATTTRWFLAVICLIIGFLSLYAAFVRFQYGTAGGGFGVADIMRGIIFLVVAVLLIFEDKIFHKNK